MAEETLNVRLCVAEDLPVLQALEAHPEARVAQRHFERQQAGEYFYAIAFRGEVPLGTCVLNTDPENPLYPELMNLWVYPQHRRQGAAKALTRYFEEMAREAGHVEIFLRVDPENEAAIPMYISLDYTPTGNHMVTEHEVVDGSGTLTSAEAVEAVYRKSLLIR